MSYLFFYIVGIVTIWWVYRVGWLETLKTILNVLIPSALIIIFNLKAGRLLFRNPLLGVVSLLPTTYIIYRGAQPLLIFINNWIDKRREDFSEVQNVVDAEVISKENE